jgi:aminomethyltransferase
MTDLRTTALHDRHEALGASFTDFGGWLMPVRYTSDLAEHHAVRTAAGLFDISHMAEFSVEGRDAAAFLDYALAGALSPLRIGKAKYSLVLAESGGIVDDVIVYRIAEHRFLVIANAGNRDAVAIALRDRLAGLEVELEDHTDGMSLIAVQGPVARAVVEATAGIADVAPALSELGYYAWASGSFHGAPLFVARTGYTGEDGFELLLPNASAPALWDALLAAGIVPAQAGLGRVVAVEKDDFVGKAGLSAVVAPDAPVLVGLVSEGRRAGRAGYAVFDGADADTPVGEITSGALSPTLGHPIAMAFVSPAASAPGTALFIDVRGTRIPATVTALPFYRRNS